MSGSPRSFADPVPTYEEIQAHVARARALRAAYVAQSLRRLGRLIVGRGGKPAAAPHGADVRPA